MALVTSASSKTLTPFSPAAIPGCVLWLDAADSNTLTLSGSNITGWNDKSVSKNHFTSAGPSTSPVLSNYNGLSAVYWSATNQQLVSASNSATPGGALRTVFYAIHCPGYSQSFIVTGTEAGGNPAKVFGMGKNAGADYVYPFLYSTIGADVYSNFQLTANPTILTARYGGSNITGWINGRYKQTKSTVFDTTAGVWYLGKRQQNGSGSFNSFMLELLQYNVELTEDQRQTVEGYLSRKWGFVSDLSADYVYRTVSPFTRAFTPLDISGCRLWLDAADRSTLTFSGTDVTGWTDKAGLGYVASNIGTITTTTVNGNTALDFGTSRMTIPNYSQNVHSTTFLVTKSATGNFIFAMNQYGTYIYLGNWDLYYFSAGGDIIQFKDTSNANGVPVVPTGQYSLVTIGYGGGSNPSAYAVNGTTRSATLTGGSARPNVVISNSMFINGNSGQSFDNSQVCEILVYNNPMTPSQAQQVEGYLSQKWGLRSGLPSTHPFTILSPLATAFTPLKVSGCIAWLDAMDPNADGTIPANGASIATWKDKSGNGKDATSQAASAPTYVSASNSISFSGTVYYKLPDGTLPLGDTPYTIVAVCAPTLADYQWVFSAGHNDLRAVGLVFYPNGTLEHGWWTRNVRTSAGVFTANQRAIVIGQYNGPGLYTYKDGTVRASNASLSGRNGAAENIYIGNRFDGNPVGFVQPFAGTISEILIFSNALSDTDRQQIEGYLAQKWNLRGSLPTTHGFKTIVP